MMTPMQFFLYSSGFGFFYGFLMAGYQLLVAVTLHDYDWNDSWLWRHHMPVCFFTSYGVVMAFLWFLYGISLIFA